MNLTQNDRLKQVTSDTLIVGVDVGSQTTSAERLTGGALNFPTGYLSSVTPEWVFSLSLGGQRNS